MRKRDKAKFFKILSNKKGQSFVEFILLFLMLVMISYVFVALFNGSVGTKWTQLVNIITSDNLNAIRSDIQLN